ncbi:MAG: GNAT family N-acetyltransferase [Dietzia sp.]
MTTTTDSNGTPVTISVRAGSPIGSYIVILDDGTTAGRADFVDSPTVEGERIFFHTEVDEAYSGRGLAGLLVRRALADSIRHGITVVPVCPLFARHLATHGDDFVADGGAFRRPSGADTAVVRDALRPD